MKVSELFEAPEKPQSPAASHKEALAALKTHGITRTSYENQPGAHQSWLRAVGKKLSPAERDKIAASLGMKEHKYAKDMGEAPKTLYVKGNHELKFGTDGNPDDENPGKGHYVTFRTAKNERARFTEGKADKEWFYGDYDEWKDAIKEDIGSKSWRAKVREKFGDDIKFWEDTVHNRIIAQRGPDKKIVATFDRKTGKPTIFSEGIAKGSWKIQNLSGVMKTFKDPEQADARAWMKNRGDASQIWDKATARWMEDPKKVDRELKKADREAAKWDRMDRAAEKARTNPKVDLQAIYNKAITAIGNTFPDGDPIDSLIGPLKRMGVPEYSIGEYIDKAMKKHGHGSEKKGMYAYLGDMWDEMARDAMYDAKNGGEAREPFVRMENGKPVKQNNPWK